MTVAIVLSWAALAGLLGSIAAEQRRLDARRLSAAAQQLAEAGIASALWRLSRDGAYAGERDTRLGAGSFSVEVRGSGGELLLLATGKIGGGRGPGALRTVRVLARKDAAGRPRVVTWQAR